MITDQRLFGFQMSIDASTSAEAGGSALGCATEVRVTLEQIIPGSAVGSPTTTLTSRDETSGLHQIVSFNSPYLLPPLSASRHSWGELKSLYR